MASVSYTVLPHLTHLPTFMENEITDSEDNDLETRAFEAALSKLDIEEQAILEPSKEAEKSN